MQDHSVRHGYINGVEYQLAGDPDLVEAVIKFIRNLTAMHKHSVKLGGIKQNNARV